VQPQGLKPISFWAAYGTAEQLAEKSESIEKSVPQGLKPNIFATVYGTTEVVPLQSSAFIRKL
jgi:hypothetical protein